MSDEVRRGLLTLAFELDSVTWLSPLQADEANRVYRNLSAKLKQLAEPVGGASPAKETMDKHTTGLYHKFNIERTDGQSAPGQKHDGCDYFVLDLTHDVHAYRALKAYIESCKGDYPRLADDLTDKLIDMRRRGLGADQSVVGAASPAPGWQPIETYSDNGEVVVWNGCRAYSAYYQDPDGWFADVDGVVCRIVPPPTHWLNPPAGGSLSLEPK